MMDDPKANASTKDDIEVVSLGNWIFYGLAFLSVVLAFVEILGYVRGDATKIAILFGLALIALLAPNIVSISIGKDGVVAELKNKMDRNNKKIEESKDATREMDIEINQKIGQIALDMQFLKEMLSKERGIAFVDGQGAKKKEKSTFSLPPIQDDDDPQKGRFGGKERNNGRTLSATVKESSSDPDWCTVTLMVRTEDGSKLEGNVEFFLHDTFSPDRYTIQPNKDGIARLVVRAWGAFTVGALADAGKTPLELDLARSRNVKAPREWRER